MAAPTALLWSASRKLSAECANCHSACIFAATRTTGRIRGRSYPAYAKGVDGDESSASPCRVRHHRRHRHEDHPGNRCRRTRPDVLASLRDIRCHSSVETLRASLVGNDRDEHIFALSQSLDLYDFYQQKMLECDHKLEQAIATMTHNVEKPQSPLPKIRIRTKQPNTPSFDVRAALYGLVGTVLTQIHGFGASLALKLIGECGTDLRAWPTAKHFTSWLCLAPGNKISGGRLLSSRTRRSSSRAAALLRLAATTIGRSDTALGAFYRRLAGRIGKQKAVTATARKVAVLFFNALRFGMAYRDSGAEAYDERHRGRVLASLQRRARALRYQLDPIPDAESVS